MCVCVCVHVCVCVPRVSVLKWLTAFLIPMYMYNIALRVCAGEDGIVYVWDLGSGSVVREYHGHEAAVSALCCSNDGAVLVSGGYDQTLRVWSLNSTRLASSPSSPLRAYTIECMTIEPRNYYIVRMI